MFFFLGPNKFLIGTEQGSILTANKRLKKSVEITTRYGVESGRHLGPVYAINRSLPNPRFFLSVGDWSAKIWFEDLKTPIIRTKYHGSYLSDGCFSPTRNGVFFLTRKVSGFIYILNKGTKKITNIKNNCEV